MFSKYMHNIDLEDSLGVVLWAPQSFGNPFYPRWEKLFRRIFPVVSNLQLIGGSGIALRCAGWQKQFARRPRC